MGFPKLVKFCKDLSCRCVCVWGGGGVGGWKHLTAFHTYTGKRLSDVCLLDEGITLSCLQFSLPSAGSLECIVVDSACFCFRQCILQAVYDACVWLTIAYVVYELLIFLHSRQQCTPCSLVFLLCHLSFSCGFVSQQNIEEVSSIFL